MLRLIADTSKAHFSFVPLTREAIQSDEYPSAGTSDKLFPFCPAAGFRIIVEIANYNIFCSCVVRREKGYREQQQVNEYATFCDKKGLVPIHEPSIY